MENINHVNSNYLIKWLLWFFFFPFAIFKTLLLFINTHQYKNKKKEFLHIDRYSRVFEWMNSFFFLNRVYSVENAKNILKTQTLFVINDSISWDSFYIFTWLSKFEQYPFVSFFTENKKYKSSSFFSNLDLFNESDLFVKYAKNKQSVCVTFSETNQDFLKIIKTNYLPITPVIVKKTKNSFFKKTISIKFLEPIKIHKVINSDKNVLLDLLSEGFK